MKTISLKDLIFIACAKLQATDAFLQSKSFIEKRKHDDESHAIMLKVAEFTSSVMEFTKGIVVEIDDGVTLPTTNSIVLYGELRMASEAHSTKYQMYNNAFTQMKTVLSYISKINAIDSVIEKFMFLLYMGIASIEESIHNNAVFEIPMETREAGIIKTQIDNSIKEPAAEVKPEPVIINNEKITPIVEPVAKSEVGKLPLQVPQFETPITNNTNMKTIDITKDMASSDWYTKFIVNKKITKIKFEPNDKVVIDSKQFKVFANMPDLTGGKEYRLYNGMKYLADAVVALIKGANAATIVSLFNRGSNFKWCELFDSNYTEHVKAATSEKYRISMASADRSVIFTLKYASDVVLLRIASKILAESNLIDAKLVIGYVTK